MSARPVPAYPDLLAKNPPRVIRTEAENKRFTAILENLDRRHMTLTRAERDYADLLTLLIENFEEQHYPVPQASPLEALRFLMDQHHLRQKDLLDVFGSPSIASEVLSGKRELSKEHIRRLSDRFSVPVELFF
jgi:HTH-type transcriptional regulator/antitoxin HigA